MNYIEDNTIKQKLKEAIVKAIAYFDLFDFPLTDFEVWQYIEMPCDLGEVVKILEAGVEKIEYQDGFYFLSGREAVIKTRMQRYNYTDRKMRRVKFLCRIFRFIPWVELVAVGNLIGQHNLRDNGDIDLLVITQEKRVWISRFFCVAVIKILGWRPTAENTRDKICLSFFVSSDSLDFFSLRLRDDDIYFKYWLVGLVPVYDSGHFYKKLINANRWLNQELPNLIDKKVSPRLMIKPIMSDYAREVIDLFSGGLEPQFKNWQLKIMPENLKKLANKGTAVIISDNILKFHENDRRKLFQAKYEQAMQKMSGSFDKNLENLLNNPNDKRIID